MRISFVKKDGAIRHITHRAGILSKYVKTDDASRTKAAIRAANNPHLMTVIDVHAHTKLQQIDRDEGGRAIRSINMDSIFEIKTNGRVIPFGRVVSHVVPLGR